MKTLPRTFELGDLETLPTHGRGTRGTFSPWGPASEAKKASTRKKWSRNGCKWDVGKLDWYPPGALSQGNNMTICCLVTDWLFCCKINPNYCILTWNYFEENILFLFWELQANLQGLQKLYFLPPIKRVRRLSSKHPPGLWSLELFHDSIRQISVILALQLFLPIVPSRKPKPRA